MNDVTILLNQLQAGEAAASDQLMVALYTELREQAVRQLSGEKPGHTLQATALVNEAYLRLVGPAHVDSPNWNSRGHFFAAAAEAMRRILVERARRKHALKRGGDYERAEIELEQLAGKQHDAKLLALDEALSTLEAEDPIKAQFGRFYRKHKVAVNAAFGTAAALLVLTCVSLYSMRQTSSALKMAHAAVYERLISAALSGDSPLTKQLLEDAREAKLDEFKLTFASAVDHYNRDEPDAAISLAESIPRDHPQFFAARALIATSHGKAGHDDKHLESLEEIRTLTPKTGEDFLYLSQAEIDRAKSLEYAKQAFQRRKSATALLCIAESMHLHANDVGNPEQARPGLRLLNAAEVYLGESTHLLAVRLATEHLLSKVTVGAERETFVARANETAKNLSVSGKNSLSWVAPLYFFDSGQFDDATSAWQGVDLRGNVLSQYIGALCLATQDDPNKALRQFDQLTESDKQNPWVRLSRIPLMRGHPKEKDNISAEMQLLRQEAGDRPELQFHLLLEMEPQSQRAYSQELLQGADGRYDAWGMHECIEFLSGEPTDKRIQQALLAVTHSSEDRCVVEYTIALRLLHEVGRRSQAIEHFTSCIDTNQWYLFVHNWAKGYVRRLENPEWPSEAWKRTF